MLGLLLRLSCHRKINCPKRLNMEHIWRTQTLNKFTMLLILILLQCHQLYAQDVIVESTTMELYTDSTTVEETVTQDSTTQQSSTEDPDQCSMDVLNNCDLVNGYCIDTRSGYTCGCNAGFQLAANKFDCEDISAQLQALEFTYCFNGTLLFGTDEGSENGTAMWMDPTIVNNTGIQVTQNYQSGTTFSIGTYEVVYSFSDAQGNLNNCSFNIQISDDELPNVICPASQLYRLSVGETTAAVNWTSATATDNVQIEDIYKISNDVPGNYEVGTYMITFGATDIYGLEGICTFSFEVADVVCPNSFSRCPVVDGECISDEFFCDLKMDCPDWADENELSCDDCLATQTRCGNAYCIDTNLFCDEFHNDCPYDDFDETSALCNGSCLSPEPLRNGEQTFPETHRRRYLNNHTIVYVCNEGFTMTGDSTLTCTDGSFGDNLPQCFAMCSRPDAPSNGAFTGNAVVDHGDIITFSCDIGFEVQPASPTTFTCDDGSFGDGVFKRCIDINECEDSNVCDSNADCTNTIGSYTCDCVDGYESDGSNTSPCTNIDECALGVSDCSVNANCTDNDGSYTCECGEGFAGDGFSCIEIIYFDYGAEYGDSRLRETFAINGATTKTIGEYLSPTFRPAAGFPYGSSFMTNVYITENGILILVDDDEEILSYPNPPTSGFQSGDTRNIIAPFWADGDLSTNVGDVLYQEYTSDDPDDESFLSEILTKLTSLYQDTLPTNFSPTWALKVTWSDIAQRPANSAKNTRNTFQSTIMTDGLYSFGIFLYQKRDMLWNPDLESPQDATIGYNIRSDGPVNVVIGNYRPDELTGNTGNLGEWVFRFENNNEDTINPKKRCLEWYSQDVTEFFSTSGLGSCPCSLRQAVRDGRYSLSPLVSISSTGIGRGDNVNTALEAFKISASLFENIVTLLNDATSYALCLQSSTFNQYLSGTQCCYRLNGFSLINGYLGIGCSSYVFKYGYTFGNWLIFNNYINHIAYDIMPQYYCCKESHDLSLCDLFYERRPAADCSQYRPPDISWMFGDPHIVTSDGYQYTFNGKGEYICSDVNDGLFQLQCRMSSPVSEEQVDATIFSAFTGVHTMGSSTHVQFTMNEDGTDFDILVNGTISVAVADLLLGSYFSSDDPEFTLNIRNSSELNPGVTRVYASWGSGIAFGIALQEKMLDVLLEFPEEFKGQTTGLFGIWNDDTSDDLCSPTMVCLNTSNTLEESDIFDIGNSWRLTENESEFVYPPGMNYDDFNDKSFRPTFLDDLKANADADLLQQATDVCGSNTECLFDALATKNIEVGMNTKTTDEDNINDVEILENIPPVIDQIVGAGQENKVGQYQLNVRVNDTITLTIEGSDENNDTITYQLESAVPGAAIDSQSGVFTWTPENTDMVSITFLVSDGSQTTSAVIDIRVCGCLNGGTCKFDDILEGSDIINNRFAIVQCSCSLAWTGYDCSEDYNACIEEPCYPGVICIDNIAPAENATCGGCPTGLIGDGFKCYDYDECAAGMDQDDQVPFCEHTELCTNTLGSYTCSCRSGYELHPNQKDCPDIDECDRGTDSCSDQAVCQNTIGSHNCTCIVGYEGNGETCEDIDECQTGVYPCDFMAECGNIDGSFTCTCSDGYSGNGVTCEDVDECRQEMHVCDPNADCVNTDGSYRCTCRDGFQGNNTYCADVDECVERALDCHPNSNCTNSIGSYLCICPAGYRGDGYTCVDINECAESDDLCREIEECVNTDASYFCRCVTGYARDTEGAECTDVDECTPVNGTGPCSINAQCVNNNGSFACGCSDGYSGDGFACLDIDECNVRTDKCGQTCTNTAGSYTCGCMDGFELGSDMLNCDPLENKVCSDMADQCGASATCVIDDNNNPQCVCDRGYMLVNMGCENIDECSTNQDGCEATNGNCTDTEGSYNCSCKTGYELLQDLRTCSDINECKDPDTCVANAECTNTDGSFTCQCLSGYTGPLCMNINECDSNSLNDCDDNAECEDTDGGYRCTCLAGYTGNGLTCIDVNECFLLDTCHELATCSNGPGTFNCTCLDGYSGDGINSCSDINECNNNPCNVIANCTNLPGTYTCACRTGYRGDGFTTCDNIDECTEQTDTCSSLATCHDTNGSYECSCIVGYEGNGVFCTDVDECHLATDACDINASCNNTIGSFTCFCNLGYMTQEGQNARSGMCEDYDECAFKIDDCSDFASCTNSIGSYHCECKTGFYGDGVTCSDTNECEQPINPCDLSNNEKCVNTDGHYLCICQTSYFNRSGECRRVITKSLTLEFLYIKGWSVELLGHDFQFDDVKGQLAADMDTLFTMSTIAEYYYGTVTDVIGSFEDGSGLNITFSVSFNDQFNITDEQLLEVFLNGLTGTNMDILKPDSQIVRDTIEIQELESNPCAENTDNCTARLFLECVYLGNEQYTCQTCFHGYVLSNDICVDYNECNDNPCGNNEMCINSVGDYTCVCNDGYVAVSSSCLAVTSFRGEIRVVAINTSEEMAAWDPQLEDPTSELYQSYAEHMCIIVTHTYSAILSTSTEFYNCSIIGFKEGSIIVVYQVNFFSNTTMQGDELLQLIHNETDIHDRLYSDNDMRSITIDLSYEAVGENLPIVCDDYCYNGGNCSINSLLERTCSCLGYFTGERCDSVACPTNYCQNRGNCSITLENPVPVCRCPEYFNGERCDSVFCPANYCQNGGTCFITLENTVPICSCRVDYTGNQCETNDGGTDSLLVAAIIIGTVVGFMLIIILMVCCFLVVIGRRRDRQRQQIKQYTAQPRGFVVRNPNSGSLFGATNYPFVQEAESISGSSSINGEESRLLHLAQVLTNAPYLNNHMRSRMSETYSEADTNDSEFIRPYIATGMEASSIEQDEYEDRPSAHKRTRRNKKFPHAFKNRSIHLFDDQNRPSTSHNMNERHQYYF
ncbi:uncharacterized protein LOC117102007 [Anneissia japonica]|uniref:uncharacterized protein LOC117102007 n=1 Tax=Anneissia japonica TaxID=1529436 RepID=UPI0014256F99|nr:uncharacterized protein LOC117102007 [Anneissia japonica]